MSNTQRDVFWNVKGSGDSVVRISPHKHGVVGMFPDKAWRTVTTAGGFPSCEQQQLWGKTSGKSRPVGFKKKINLKIKGLLSQRFMTTTHPDPEL